MNVEMKRKHGKFVLAFKNRAVYPIKTFNLANSIIYAKSLICAKAHKTSLIWADSDHYGRNPCRDCLRVRSSRLPRV